MHVRRGIVRAVDGMRAVRVAVFSLRRVTLIPRKPREIHAIRVLVLVANLGIVIYLWQRKEMFE